MTKAFAPARLIPVVVALVAALALTTTGAAPPGTARAAGDGSGGKAVAHHGNGKVVRTAAARRNAPDARLLRTSHDATEPTLGITKKGDIFYAAYGSIPNGNDVLYSKDGGRKWEVRSPKVGNQNVHAVTLDPYVWVDERTGRVYTIDLTVACSYLSYSDDKGKSWITNPLSCGVPVNDHQTLFGGPPVSSPTTVYDNLIYYCYNGLAHTTCTKSVDGGLTFAPTGEPAYTGSRPREGEPGGCHGLNGHGVVGDDGTIYLPKEACDEPWLFISRDEGQTWDSVKVSTKKHPYGPDPTVAVDKKGNIYYVFTGEDIRPYLVVSTDGGKRWSDPIRISAPGLVETEMPTIDAGDPGKIAIAYYGTANAKGPVAGRDYSKATWNGYITTTTNALAKRPLFYSSTINTPKDPFYRGRCNVATNRCDPVYDFMDVEISKDGTPYAAFVDACGALCKNGTTNDIAEGVVGSLRGGKPLR